MPRIDLDLNIPKDGLYRFRKFSRLTPKFNKLRQKGSSSLLLLINLSLILSLILFTTQIISIQRIRLKQNEICIDKQFEVHYLIVTSIQKILALNPSIKFLRFKKNQLKVLLAAAISTQNLALIIKYKTDLKNTEILLAEIYKVQLQIKNNFRILRDINNQQIHHLFQKSKSDYNSVWYKFISLMTHIKTDQLPELGLVPDSAENPPIFEIDQQSHRIHTLAIKMKNRFSDQSKFNDSCEGTTQWKNEKWSLVIQAGKY